MIISNFDISYIDTSKDHISYFYICHFDISHFESWHSDTEYFHNFHLDIIDVILKLFFISIAVISSRNETSKCHIKFHTLTTILTYFEKSLWFWLSLTWTVISYFDICNINVTHSYNCIRTLLFWQLSVHQSSFLFQNIFISNTVCPTLE